MHLTYITASILQHFRSRRKWSRSGSGCFQTGSRKSFIPSESSAVQLSFIFNTHTRPTSSTQQPWYIIARRRIVDHSSSDINNYMTCWLQWTMWLYFLRFYFNYSSKLQSQCSLFHTMHKVSTIYNKQWSRGVVFLQMCTCVHLHLHLVI